MKTTVSLMKIGIGIEIPCCPGTHNLVNYSSKSADIFIDKIMKYDFSKFGVCLRSVENVNICGVIGIMFDIEDVNTLNVSNLTQFIQSFANKTIKDIYSKKTV